jgi:hypothetical protein
MSKSPLSGAFAGSSEPAKKNKKNGALLLISGIALATSIGGVFAATSTNIDLNGGVIEFGQGAAEVEPCAASAEVSMAQILSAGEFYVGTVTVTFPANECNGKSVTVTLLGANGAPLTGANFTDVVADDEVEEVFVAGDAIIAGNVEDVAVSTAD